MIRRLIEEYSYAQIAAIINAETSKDKLRKKTVKRPTTKITTLFALRAINAPRMAYGRLDNPYKTDE
jgi:hypothetical protein